MTTQELPALPTVEETHAFIEKLHAWAATLPSNEQLALRLLAAAAGTGSEQDAEVQGYGWVSIAVGGVLGGPAGAMTAAVLGNDTVQDTAGAAWQGYSHYATSLGRQILATSSRVSRL